MFDSNLGNDFIIYSQSLSTVFSYLLTNNSFSPEFFRFGIEELAQLLSQTPFTKCTTTKFISQ